jgi:hypothetical protein
MIIIEGILYLSLGRTTTLNTWYVNQSLHILGSTCLTSTCSGLPWP